MENIFPPQCISSWPSESFVLRICLLNVEIYAHINTLIYENSITGSLGRNNSTSILKSSNARTPAPTSKVLRWEDLEAATAEAADQMDYISTRSIVGTEEGCRDVLGDQLWQDDHFDSEELFV